MKNSFTPDKNLFSGTKEEIEPQRNFPDEVSIDFANSYQTLSDAAIFITYSFQTVKDTIQCFFNKIGIIKNGQFFNCEHASVPYVIYTFVDERLTAKIKEEEKQKIYFLEQQKERIQQKEKIKSYESMLKQIHEEQEISRRRQAENNDQKELLAKQISFGVIVGVSCYGLYQVAKWSAATIAAPTTGGASWGLVAVTP